jgi:hypothetical protein
VREKTILDSAKWRKGFVYLAIDVCMQYHQAFILSDFQAQMSNHLKFSAKRGHLYLLFFSSTHD